MRFLLLVGAASNAIAYESKQFSSGEVFLWGLPTGVNAETRPTQGEAQR